MATKFIAYQARLTPEEVAKLELIRRDLGLKSKAAVFAFLISQQYRKTYGTSDASRRLRDIEWIEREGAKSQDEYSRAHPGYAPE